MEKTQKVSSLEYKLKQILSGYVDEDLTSGFSPRTLIEEEQSANESLREQLQSFKNANGSSIDLQIINSISDKPNPEGA